MNCYKKNEENTPSSTPPPCANSPWNVFDEDRKGNENIGFTSLVVPQLNQSFPLKVVPQFPSFSRQESYVSAEAYSSDLSRSETLNRFYSEHVQAQTTESAWHKEGQLVCEVTFYFFLCISLEFDSFFLIFRFNSNFNSAIAYHLT